MLFFTGITRQASSVLTEQRQNIPDRLPILREMKRLALEAKASVEAGEFDELGRLLDTGWQLKRQMASGVSNGAIDAIYEGARKAGAYGGKITGAGGGGYLLLYCPVSKQDDVRCALKQLTELPFSSEQDGSKVIFNYRRN
jgi:D-glycero-alpha-D-manno-heptose-7-phosphate kinase